MTTLNGQSAAEPLKSSDHEEGSTTIPRKGSTGDIPLEIANFKQYNLSDRFPAISCIYAIKSLHHDKVYIGSAHNLNSRLIRHRWYLRHNKHHSLKLQRVFNKYGESNLKVHILESTDNLMQREDFWIKHENSFINGFNCTDRSLGNHTFKLTEEQKEKAVRKCQKGVIQIAFDGTIIAHHISVSKAARTVKTSSSNISRCCKGKLNFMKDSIWVYEKEFDKTKDYSYKGRVYNFTESHKAKISGALKGRPMHPNRLKASLNQGTRVLVFKLNGDFIQKFKSMKEAAAYAEVIHKTLKNYIISKKPLNDKLYKFEKDIV